MRFHKLFSLARRKTMKAFANKSAADGRKAVQVSPSTLQLNRNRYKPDGRMVRRTKNRSATSLTLQSEKGSPLIEREWKAYTFDKNKLDEFMNRASNWKWSTGCCERFYSTRGRAKVLKQSFLLQTALIQPASRARTNGCHAAALFNANMLVKRFEHAEMRRKKGINRTASNIKAHQNGFTEEPWYQWPSPPPAKS